ncbi:MAG: hypothetical protein HPY85_02190 [Anaerolineae bacterium]|nr:hypothetical protein [Anaerolineae bacterium]
MKRNHLTLWLAERLEVLSDQPRWLTLPLLVFSTGFLISWILVWTPMQQLGTYQFLFLRIKPLILYFCLFSAQNLAAIALVQHQLDPGSWDRIRGLIKKPHGLWITIFLILLGMVFIALITGWGFHNDGFYWNVPAIPMRMGEIAVLIYVVLWMLWFGERYLQAQATRFVRVDTVLFAVLVGLTAIIWYFTPMQSSFFAPGPELPNNDYYPYSDAAYYAGDAHLALIGQGMGNGGEVDKPLYSAFVFLVHLVGGIEDYQRIAAVHAVFLAIGAGLIYLIGAAIHKRVTGMAAAIAFALLGRNMILSSGMALSANPKLLITGFFSGVILLLLTLFMIRWVQFPREMKWVLYAGAVMGFSVYARHNFWFILPILMLFIPLVRWKDKGVRFQPVAFLLVAFLATFLPWFIRDAFRDDLQPLDDRVEYRLFSRFGFTPEPQLKSPVNDHQFVHDRTVIQFRWRGFQTDLQYSLQVTKDGTVFYTDTYQPDEVCTLNRLSCEVPVEGDWSTGDYQWQITTVNLHQWRRESELFTFTVVEEGETGYSTYHAIPGAGLLPVFSIDGPAGDESLWSIVVVPILNHWYHNLIAGIVSLPMQINNADLPGIFHGDFSLWVEGQDLELTAGQWGFLVVNLTVLSVGLTQAYRRSSWAGLMPVILVLGYNTGLAVARTSGGRYLSAFFWVFWLYWLAGVVSIAELVPAFFGRAPMKKFEDEMVQPVEPGLVRWNWQWLPGLLALLSVGLFPVIIDQCIPPRYPLLEEKDQVDQFIQKVPGYGDSEREILLDKLANQQYLEIRTGRLLFPRFYWANKGGQYLQTAYGVLDYDRLVITIVGPQGISYGIQRLSEGQIPVAPQASDVVMAGCANSLGVYDILGLVIEKNGETWYYEVSEVDTWSCDR